MPCSTVGLWWSHVCRPLFSTLIPGNRYNNNHRYGRIGDSGVCCVLCYTVGQSNSDSFWSLCTIIDRRCEIKFPPLDMLDPTPGTDTVKPQHQQRAASLRVPSTLHVQSRNELYPYRQKSILMLKHLPSGISSSVCHHDD